MVKIIVAKYMWDYDWVEEWVKEYKITDADYSNVKEVLDFKLKGNGRGWYWREYGDERFEIEICEKGLGNEITFKEFEEMVDAIGWLDAFENWKW